MIWGYDASVAKVKLVGRNRKIVWTFETLSSIYACANSGDAVAGLSQERSSTSSAPRCFMGVILIFGKFALPRTQSGFGRLGVVVKMALCWPS